MRRIGRRLPPVILLLAVATLAACWPSRRFRTIPSSDWWTFQHDSLRTGYALGGVGRVPKPMWDASLVTGTTSLTPPVFGFIGDTGRIFIGAGYGDGKLRALSPYTGAVLWSFAAAPSTGFFGAPTAANANVYAATLGTTPHVYAVRQRTGAVVWQTPIPGGTGSRSSVAVASGRVFVNTDQHRLYALDQRTGAVLWSSPTSPGTSSEESSPAVALGRVYVGSDDGLYAFDIGTGALAWKYPLTDIVGFSSPVFQPATATSPPLVLIGTNDRKLHAVNAATGAGVWVHTAGATLAFGTVGVAAGRVFLFDYSSVVALDVFTGNVLWTQTMPRIPRHSPAIAGRTLFYSDDQDVQALDVTTGAPGWQAPVPGNGNANAPGAELAVGLEILLVPNKGHLHAFR